MADDETLAQLLQPQTPAEIFNQEKALGATLGLPTSTWQPGGVTESQLLLNATIMSNISSSYIPSAVAGLLLPLSSGLYLDLLASNYQLTRNPATYTDGYVTLDTSASGAGPYTITANSGQYVIFPDGLRYTFPEDVSVPSDGYISLVHVRSEFPVDTTTGFTYSEGNDQSLSLLNPLPGVVVTNPSLNFSAVAHNGLGAGSAGIGTGTITPTGIPLDRYFIIVRIDSSGEAGAAIWSYSTDGAEYVSVGSATSAEIFDGAVDTGVLVTLSNGSPTPSFVIGDTYTFSTPESWIFSQGANIESDDSLRQRCGAQLPALGSDLTFDVYSYLVKSTPGVGSQVTGVIVQADGYVGDKINIVIWGPEGAFTSTTTDAVQDYLNARVPQTEFPVVTSPGSLNVGYTLTLTVPANAYNAMFGTTGFDGTIGDLLNTFTNTAPANSLIERAVLIGQLIQIGVLNIDVGGLLINGVASDLQLGSATTFQLAVFSQGSTTITWIRK